MDEDDAHQHALCVRRCLVGGMVRWMVGWTGGTEGSAGMHALLDRVSVCLCVCESWRLMRTVGNDEDAVGPNQVEEDVHLKN